MFVKFIEKLDNHGKIFIVLLAITQIFILGVLDYHTGFEISFSVFYLIPVAMTAWYAEKNTALVISVFSAITWHFSNQLAGETFSNFLIPIWNSSTRLGFFLVVTVLLTKLKASYLCQKSLAQTDFLTGAVNPRAFYEAVEMEIIRSRRYERSFTVCYLDADNFKRINDTLGHNVGSNLLIKVVRNIKQTLRATDMVARMGGDEFAILLPETDKQQAQVVINKLRERLLSEMRSEGWSVTFSIGVSTYGNSPQSVDEVIKFADNLMYEVKRNGKNSAKFREFKNAVSLQPHQQKETVQQVLTVM